MNPMAVVTQLAVCDCSGSAARQCALIRRAGFSAEYLTYGVCAAARNPAGILFQLSAFLSGIAGRVTDPATVPCAVAAHGLP